MTCEEGVFTNNVLPLGLQLAPEIFTAAANAVEWIIHQKGVKDVLHYLEDLLLIGAPSSNDCKHAPSTLLSVFSHLGLPVMEDKLEAPTFLLTLLGLELVTMTMELRLPVEKVSTSSPSPKGCGETSHLMG